MFGKVYRRGNAWWIRYRANGQDVRVSVAVALGIPTAEASERDAKNLLKAKVTEAFEGRHVGPSQMRLTVTELVTEYVEGLRLLNKRWRTAEGAARAPLAVFGPMRAVHLTTPALKAYLKQRVAAGLAPATIMQEIWVLRAAFNMARAENRLTVVPVFPSLTVKNARQGFVEPEQFEAIQARLGAQVYRDAATLAYVAARRINEVLRLPWEWVDRASPEIRWPDSKNGDPVAIPLDAELAALIERRWKDRAIGQWLSPWVFHLNQRGPLSDSAFSHRFGLAAAAAGYPGLTPHDMRRSGVRNLLRSGVDRDVVMSISGHRSDSMLRRYNITSPEDKTRAFAQVAAYRRSRTVGRTISHSESGPPAEREQLRAVGQQATK